MCRENELYGEGKGEGTEGRERKGNGGRMMMREVGSGRERGMLSGVKGHKEWIMPAAEHGTHVQALR